MARPASGVAKKGKKNRKHGRNKNSPAMKRYVAENRLEKNKARRIAKAARRKRNGNKADQPSGRVVASNVRKQEVAAEYPAGK